MALAQKQRAKTENKTDAAVQLKGSTKMVTEFFEYGLNSILYQREVLPAAEFKPVKKYNLPMMVVQDEVMERYVKKIMSQVNAWLLSGQVDRLVLCIISKELNETIERWQFDVELEKHEDEQKGKDKEGEEGSPSPPPNNNNGRSTPPPPESSNATKPTRPLRSPGRQRPLLKDEKLIQSEIQRVIKQITATATFLPTVEEECTFNILVYTNKEAEVDEGQWKDDDEHFVRGQAELVKLRSWSTNIHKVDSMVAYRVGDPV